MNPHPKPKDHSTTRDVQKAYLHITCIMQMPDELNKSRIQSFRIHTLKKGRETYWQLGKNHGIQIIEVKSVTKVLKNRSLTAASILERDPTLNTIDR